MLQRLSHIVRTRRAHRPAGGRPGALKCPADDQGAAWMLITFQPMGESRAWPIATAWLEDGFVRWHSPCLDKHHQQGDRVALASIMGDCACAFPAFMRSMEWLDAQCFGARDLVGLAATCEAATEYGLACVIREPSPGLAA